MMSLKIDWVVIDCIKQAFLFSAYSFDFSSIYFDMTIEFLEIETRWWSYTLCNQLLSAVKSATCLCSFTIFELTTRHFIIVTDVAIFLGHRVRKYDSTDVIRRMWYTRWSSQWRLTVCGRYVWRTKIFRVVSNLSNFLFIVKCWILAYERKSACVSNISSISVGLFGKRKLPWLSKLSNLMARAPGPYTRVNTHWSVSFILPNCINCARSSEPMLLGTAHAAVETTCVEQRVEWQIFKMASMLHHEGNRVCKHLR